MQERPPGDGIHYPTGRAESKAAHGGNVRGLGKRARIKLVCVRVGPLGSVGFRVGPCGSVGQKKAPGAGRGRETKTKSSCRAESCGNQVEGQIRNSCEFEKQDGFMNIAPKSSLAHLLELGTFLHRRLLLRRCQKLQEANR